MCGISGQSLDTCRLHCCSVYATILQPPAYLIKVASEAAEATVVVPISIGGNTYLHLGIGDVYACCVRIHNF